MLDFAFAQGSTPHGSSPWSALLFQLFFFAFLFALFYFLLIRPQQKARKKHQEFLAKLKKGDRVINILWEELRLMPGIWIYCPEKG
jgi:preprotein translocase subunit YajC